MGIDLASAADFNKSPPVGYLTYWQPGTDYVSIEPINTRNYTSVYDSTNANYIIHYQNCPSGSFSIGCSNNNLNDDSIFYTSEQENGTDPDNG